MAAFLWGVIATHLFYAGVLVILAAQLYRAGCAAQRRHIGMPQPRIVVLPADRIAAAATWSRN